MARVLFVETDLRNEKLGIMYLSAVLKQSGHETLLCWYERDNIDDIIKLFKPDFAAFSLTTGAHKKQLEIAERIKQAYDLKIIVGGPHATFFTRNIPENIADFVVVGQGESAIVDIVENRTAQRILIYGFRDLNSIPFPDRSLFYRFEEFRDNPMKNIITTRDCPYSCSYCYNHSWKEMFSGQPFFMQRRSVDNVIDEAKELKRDYFLEKILFIDDNFLVNDRWIEEFCEKYRKEIGLPFLCSFRVDLLNEHKLKMLKDAGLFMVNFALESADPVVQRDILNRGAIKNDDVIRAIELFKKYDVKCRMQNMIGLPLRESLKDALNTLDFNKRHKVDDSWVSIFQPYPNTRLAEYCIKNGFIDGSIENSIAESFFDESRIKIDNKEKIRRLQKWWYFIIKYNFSKALTDILLEVDFDDAIGNELQKLRFEFSKRYLYNVAENNKLLDYNWDIIVSRFGRLPNFRYWADIIKKYELCTGLCEILMKMNIPWVIKEKMAGVAL